MRPRAGRSNDLPASAVPAGLSSTASASAPATPAPQSPPPSAAAAAAVSPVVSSPPCVPASHSASSPSPSSPASSSFSLLSRVRKASAPAEYKRAVESAPPSISSSPAIGSPISEGAGSPGTFLQTAYKKMESRFTLGTPMSAKVKAAIDTHELDLSKSDATVLPKHTRYLSELRSLNLNYNNIQELKRKKVKHFSQLEHLLMAANRLTVVPDEVALLTTLKALDLGCNQLDTLPASLEALANLEHLGLVRNNFRTFPAIAWKRLSSLRLRFNQLTGIDGMVHLEALTKLYLGNNLIAELPPEIARLRNLKELHIEHNKLVTLPDEIAELTNLQELRLNGNQLESLPEAACRAWSNLMYLTVADNRLMELPKALGALTALRKLDCYNNGLARFPDSLCEIEGLADIDAHFNCIESLPAEIGRLRMLRKLNLACNRLQSPLPESFWDLAALEELNLGINMLSSLPAEIGQLRKLAVFSCFGNSLETLPEDLACLPYLRQLMVGYNELTSVFKEMKWLFNLQVLFVAGNHIRELPPDIGKVRNLESVYLGGNNIYVGEELKQLPRILTRDGAPKDDIHAESPRASASHERALYLVPSIKQGVYSTLSTRFSYACALMTGMRKKMEDAAFLTGSFSGNSAADLLAVYDGHGGPDVAEYATKHFEGTFERILKRHEAETPDSAHEPHVIVNSLREAFLELNEEMRSVIDPPNQGTTAAVAYLLGSKLFLANVGDSRAIIVREGRVKRITLDHKPYEPEEHRRIQAMGGYTGEDNRLNGVIAVSRALGDFALQPYLSPEPHVEVEDIDSKTDLLIMATDGLWDVMSDQMAATVALKESDPHVASVKLRDYAYLLGSTDNITVAVVYFHPGQTTTSELMREATSPPGLLALTASA